jgi:endonuclease/exonuclease/phosphatase family metal-dependent hydrolase
MPGRTWQETRGDCDSDEVQVAGIAPTMTQLARALGPALLLATSLGCATVTNYLDPASPRYETGGGDQRDLDPALRVVTFNVEKGLRVDRAVAALTRHPELAGADIVVLQEMGAEGVASVAAALRMSSVYYPASREPGGGADWGNAILSPWPIQDTSKLLLPHRSRFTGRARIASVARVLLPGGPVRVYSTQLGSPLGMGPGSRRDQAATILADAEGSRDPVILAGDFNSHGLGRLFEEHGYCWPTKNVGASVRGFSFDHVFARGLCSGPLLAGVARDVKDASDHRPVWALLGARGTVDTLPVRH